MLDFAKNPFPQGADIQIFTGIQVNTVNADPAAFATWEKPRGKSMAYMLCIGAGGGGGGGFVGAVAAAGGGGGGGSGAQASLLVPVTALPDILYVGVGLGGAGGGGGSPGANGVRGVNTMISINPDTIAQTFILRATCSASVGVAGSAIAGGSAGTGGGMPTVSQDLLAGLGKYTFFIGQNGTAGGFNTTAPTAVVYPTTGLIVSGGAGGGGIQTAASTAGADVTGAGVIPTSLGGAGGTTGVNGADGSHGLGFLSQLRIFTGGAGGGSGDPVPVISNGGNGGAGGFGCGGGGGGSAVTLTTAGTGGRGGDGIAIIICW